VDPALVSHYFGSKNALWEAVVDRMSQRLQPSIADLEDLNRRTSVPIRIRLGNGLWQLLTAACDEPEFGMFLSRAGDEKNERLNLLVKKLLRPHHDAFLPILLEAMQQKVIGKQPVEILYFMLVQAIAMTVSYRHILGEFGAGVDDIAKLKAGVMHCIYGTFLERHDARTTDKEDVRKFTRMPGRGRESAQKRTAPR
jgi:AcrR family transcriptional regulator